MSDGRLRVWRKRGEDLRNSEKAVLSKDMFGRGGVMVWGGVWHGGRTPLVFIEGGLTGRRYIDEILDPVVLPTGRQEIGRRFRYQHDGATAHTAVIVRNHLRDNRVAVLSWAAKSPDMNPIEHVWDIIGRRLYDRYAAAPANLGNLQQRIREIWNAIPQVEIDNIIDSLPRRCQALIDANGGPTTY